MRSKYFYRMVLIIIFINKSYVISQPLIFCRDLDKSLVCDRNIVLADHTINPNSLTISINILVSNNTLCITPGCLVYTNSVLLSDQSYFDPLGSVLIKGKTIDGYRLKSIIYTGFPAYHAEISLGVSGPIINGVFPYSAMTKKCGSCFTSFSRFQYQSLFLYLYSFSNYLSPHVPPMPAFKNWGIDKAPLATILNWFINNNNPTDQDWQDVLDKNSVGNSSVPLVFGQIEVSCPCMDEIYNYYYNFIQYVEQNWSLRNTTVVNYLNNYLRIGCNCSAFFCPEYSIVDENNVEKVQITLIPAYQGFFPALVISIYKYQNVFYYNMASSMNFIPLSGCGNNGENCIGFNRVEFVKTQSTGYVNYIDPDFQSFDVMLTATCSEMPCKDCIGSFSPIPGEEYILTAWTKEEQVNPGDPVEISSYDSPFIAIDFSVTSGPTTTVGPFGPSGPIIDGWQKIEEVFTVPMDASKINLRLAAQNTNAYFDDIRISPKRSNMKSFVYDNISKKLVAELDEQNYATFYEYDQEGKLVRIKKESERGILTIKENRSNTPKK